MIKYDRFWVTMKERGITQYDLYEHYQITRSLLDRLRKNKNVEIYTIDRLCSILHCEIEDIVEHVPEPDERNEHTEKASEKNNPYSEDKKNSLTVIRCSFFVSCAIRVRESFSGFFIKRYKKRGRSPFLSESYL